MIVQMPAYQRLFAAALVASALVVACAPSGRAEAQGANHDEESSAQRASGLVTRWTIIVSNRFEDSKAFKSDETDSLIDQFLSSGAVRAVNDKAGADKLREADAVVDRFTAAAIRAGQRHEDGSTEVLDEAVIAGIKSVCPVYPFC
jgi:hypothetical protein